MQLSKRSKSNKSRGQTLVEFALILPVLLLTMYGVMEFGRLLFIYVTTASATREAARYAAAVGISDNGVPFYNDCTGIRAAAQRVGILAGIRDADISIQYDKGPGTTPYSNSCPAPGAGPELGDRIVVIVTGHFNPIVPMVPIPIRDIHSETARTIIRNVRVSENFIAPQIVVTQPPSPYVFFEESQSYVSEDVGGVNVFICVDEAPAEPLTVEIGVIDVLEALGGGIDYYFTTSRTVVFEEGELGEVGSIENCAYKKSIGISINNDSLFELTERIVLYIRSVSNNNIGYPRLHVIRIFDNDPLPIVYFDPAGPTTVVENEDNLIIPVKITESGAPASVGVTVTPLTNGPGYDYTSERLIFPVDYSSDYRTITLDTQYFFIYPIPDGIATGDRQIRLELSDPTNADTMDTDPDFPSSWIITIIDDDICNLSFSTAELSGSSFDVYIVNNGGVAHLSRMDLEFTAADDSKLIGVDMNGVIWSGEKGSPAVINTADWVSDDRSIAGGSSERIRLNFSESILTIESMSLDFSCMVLDIAPPPIVAP
jgi:hypothetical protein